MKTLAQQYQDLIGQSTLIIEAFLKSSTSKSIELPKPIQLNQSYTHLEKQGGSFYKLTNPATGKECKFNHIDNAIRFIIADTITLAQ